MAWNVVYGIAKICLTQDEANVKLLPSAANRHNYGQCAPGYTYGTVEKQLSQLGVTL